MERYSRLDKTYAYMWLTQWPIWRPADMEEYNVADMVADMVANMVADKVADMICPTG